MSRRDFRSFLTSPAYRVKFKMEDGLRACLWSHNPKTLASIRRVVRETFPVWYKIGLLVVVPPAASLGGFLRLRQSSAQ